MWNNSFCWKTPVWLNRKIIFETIHSSILGFLLLLQLFTEVKGHTFIPFLNPLGKIKWSERTKSNIYFMLEVKWLFKPSDIVLVSNKTHPNIIEMSRRISILSGKFHGHRCEMKVASHVFTIQIPNQWKRKVSTVPDGLMGRYQPCQQ